MAWFPPRRSPIRQKQSVPLGEISHLPQHAPSSEGISHTVLALGLRCSSLSAASKLTGEPRPIGMGMSGALTAEAVGRVFPAQGCTGAQRRKRSQSDLGDFSRHHYVCSEVLPRAPSTPAKAGRSANPRPSGARPATGPR